MSERVIVNASPMIALLGIGQEGLLPRLFGEVLLPEAVRDEIEAGLSKDANVGRLAKLSGIETAPSAPVPESVEGWGLGRGESAVLAVASTEANARAVLDDLAARRCARFLGVPVLGTGRILVMAKQRGLISSVGEQIERLSANQFRMSPKLIGMLLHAAGERD